MKQALPCPTLADLCAPPAGKTGWPWTEESPAAGPAPTGGWPAITIVTPTFQQGHFIEETIRSVLLQGYQNLEFIIIDGGSTDRTVEIIKKYSPWITYWVSEKDAGQSDAINKGFARATGVLGNWLNSDDILLPGALHKFGKAFDGNTRKLVAGDVINYHEGTDTGTTIRQSNITFENHLCYWRKLCIEHPDGLYFPVDLYRKIQGVDKSLFFSMDFDLYARLLHVAAGVLYLREPVIKFRYHSASKSSRFAYVSWIEKKKVFYRYKDRLPNFKQAEFGAMFAAGSAERMIRSFRRKEFTAMYKICLTSLAVAPLLTLSCVAKEICGKAFKVLTNRNH